MNRDILMGRILDVAFVVGYAYAVYALVSIIYMIALIE